MVSRLQGIVEIQTRYRTTVGIINKIEPRKGLVVNVLQEESEVIFL